MPPRGFGIFLIQCLEPVLRNTCKIASCNAHHTLQRYARLYTEISRGAYSYSTVLFWSWCHSFFISFKMAERNASRASSFLVEMTIFGSSFALGGLDTRLDNANRSSVEPFLMFNPYSIWMSDKTWAANSISVSCVSSEILRPIVRMCCQLRKSFLWQFDYKNILVKDYVRFFYIDYN